MSLFQDGSQMSDLSALCDDFGFPKISDESRPVHPMDPYNPLPRNYQSLLEHMAIGPLRPNKYLGPESVVSGGVDGTAHLLHLPCPTGDRFVPAPRPLSLPPGLAELSSVLISNQYTQADDDPLSLFPELQGSSHRPSEPVDFNGAFQPINVNTVAGRVSADTVVVPPSTNFFLDEDFFEPTVAATDDQTSSGNSDCRRSFQVQHAFPDSARGLVRSNQVPQSLIDQFMIDQDPLDSTFTPAHGESAHRASSCRVGAIQLPDLPDIPEAFSQYPWVGTHSQPPPTFCDFSLDTELTSHAQPYFPQLPNILPDNGENAPVLDDDSPNLFAALREPLREEHRDQEREKYPDIGGHSSPAQGFFDPHSVSGSSVACLLPAVPSPSINPGQGSPMMTSQGGAQASSVRNGNDDARRRDGSFEKADQRGRMRAFMTWRPNAHQRGREHTLVTWGCDNCGKKETLSVLVSSADTERSGRPTGFLYGCSLDCRVKLMDDEVSGGRLLETIHGVCRSVECSFGPHLARAAYLRGSKKDRCRRAAAKELSRNKRQVIRANWITEVCNGFEVVCSLCNTSHRVGDIPDSVFALPAPNGFVDSCEQGLTHKDNISPMAARWCESGDCRAGCPEGHVVRNSDGLSDIFPKLCSEAAEQHASNALAAITTAPVAATDADTMQSSRVFTFIPYVPSDTGDQVQPILFARRGGPLTGGRKRSSMSVWECNNCGATERLCYSDVNRGAPGSAQEVPYGCTPQCVLTLARTSKSTRPYSTIRGVCRNTAHCALAPHVVLASTLRGRLRDSCKRSKKGIRMEALKLATWISISMRGYQVTCSHCDTPHAVSQISQCLLQEPAPIAFADSNLCKTELVNAGMPEPSIARWCRSGDCHKDCPDGHILRNGSLNDMSKTAPDLCRAAFHRLGLGSLG